MYKCLTMKRVEPIALSTLRSDIAHLYQSDSPEAGQLRASNLAALVRLTPQTMLANVGSGALVMWAYAPTISLGMWCWFLALTALCGLAMNNWRMTRRRAWVSVSPKAFHRGTVHAFLLSGVWAIVPVTWFSTSTVGQQMTVATLVAGMMGAGGFVLSPLPYASCVYVAVFSLAALIALASTGEVAYAGVAFLILFYGPIVSIGALMAWRKSMALLRSEARASKQEQILSVLLADFEENAGDALWETDLHGNLKHASSRLQALLGFAEDQGGATHFLRWLAERQGQGIQTLHKAMASNLPFNELPLSLVIEGRDIHLQVNGKPLWSETGELSGWRGVVTDVSDKVRSTQLLNQLAHTDFMTGLSNRFTLREALTKLLAQKSFVALFSIDLDRFKAVNDRHGHSAGDEVLKSVADRLRQDMGGAAVVARLGGDEFAVVLQGQHAINAVQLTAQRLVDLLSGEICTPTRTFNVGASVGIAVSHGDVAGIDDLMLQADIALYAAKESGRGRWVEYVDALGEKSRRRVTIENELRHAIERGEMQLYWQPKFSLNPWSISGAEGLMRWSHPTLGSISPGEFIPIAEQCGLINALGLWAIQEACRVVSQDLAELTISVNVSSIQLRDVRFASQVREALETFQVAPKCLELELTESVFLEDAEQSQATLHQLRSIGVRLALDDFGTGYSSLSYLRSFPFDTLKIDQTFVKELVHKSDARALVRMISQMAQVLGMRTVCEGVETEEQLGVVRAAKCDEVQGYLVSPPVPLGDFLVKQEVWKRAPWA
jgi:diguanylate cyclase (GGDEF)-like protein